MPFRLLAQSSARAQESVPIGATPQTVLQALGTPLEKIEYEIKREVRWVYPNGRKIRFYEGKVSEDLQLASPLAIPLASPLANPLEKQNEGEIAPISPEDASAGGMNSSRTDKPSQTYTFTGTDVFREIARLNTEDEATPPNPAIPRFQPQRRVP
ncbi:MAG: hypothetical protein KDD60_07655 [Bdellovibrionales bacterium]|nr:hypothetical protein [Bdellovibrionales bacterium]